MTSKDIKKLPYRLCVGAMMFNSEGLVFVGQRAGWEPDHEAWQMPQGGVDDGECPRDALQREFHEETGTDQFDIISESSDWHAYDLPEELVAETWHGRYRGQKQKWFALRFTGTDGDIDLTASGHPEFSQWKWVSIDDVPDLIVPFKRKVYERVVAEFRHLAIPAP